MDKYELTEELRGMIQESLNARNLDLVDLICRYEGGNLFLRILTDRPEGGISLDECARLNRDIGIFLDEKDILQQRYILEVSSPGLDRPLVTKNDFLRCVNRKTRVLLKDPVNEKWELEGIIVGAQADTVSLRIQDKTIEVPLSKIAKAKQILENI